MGVNWDNNIVASSDTAVITPRSNEKFGEVFDGGFLTEVGQVRAGEFNYIFKNFGLHYQMLQNSGFLLESPSYGYQEGACLSYNVSNTRVAATLINEQGGSGIQPNLLFGDPNAVEFFHQFGITEADSNVNYHRSSQSFSFSGEIKLQHVKRVTRRRAQIPTRGSATNYTTFELEIYIAQSAFSDTSYFGFNTSNISYSSPNVGNFRVINKNYLAWEHKFSLYTTSDGTINGIANTPSYTTNILNPAIRAIFKSYVLEPDEEGGIIPDIVNFFPSHNERLYITVPTNNIPEFYVVEYTMSVVLVSNINIDLRYPDFSLPVKKANTGFHCKCREIFRDEKFNTNTTYT